MFDRSSSLPSSQRHGSIHLDFGMDETACAENDFEVTHHGIVFKSRWQFDVGTQLDIRICYDDTTGDRQRIVTEGMAVGCERIGNRCFFVTVLFLDPPEELATALEASRELDAEVESSDAPEKNWRSST